MCNYMAMDSNSNAISVHPAKLVENYARWCPGFVSWILTTSSCNGYIMMYLL